MSQWFVYYENREEKPPPKGYVKYRTTFDPEREYYEDLYRNKPSIWWNRASPCVVKEYTFVEKNEFLSKHCLPEMAKKFNALGEELNKLKKFIDSEE